MRARSLAVPVALLLTRCLVSFEDYPVQDDGRSGSGGTMNPDASAGGSAGSLASGGSSGSAGTTSTTDADSESSDASLGCVVGISDDFEKAALDTTLWWNDSKGGMTIAPVSGRLQITFPTNTLNGAYGGISSLESYPLNECAIFVQASNPAIGPKVYTLFGVAYEDRYIQFTVSDSLLYAREDVVGGTTGFSYSETFNAATHAWWRLRVAGATLFWEVSADGSNWATFTSLPLPADLPAVRVYLGAGALDLIATEKTASFDNLNLAGVAAL
jgi:hypothetical protein